MIKCGIYIITDQKGRVYVGSSKDVDLRIKQHSDSLRKGKHINKKLQDYYKKYGVLSFTYSVIDLCNQDDLLLREQYFIDTLSPFYNVNLSAIKPPSWAGKKHSPETIEKIRQWNIGRKHTPEALQKLKEFRNSEAGKLQQKNNGSKRTNFVMPKMSEEKKVLMSNIHKGRIVSKETREKLSNAFKGRKASEETKRKMSASHTQRLLELKKKAS